MYLNFRLGGWKCLKGKERCSISAVEGDMDISETILTPGKMTKQENQGPVWELRIGLSSREAFGNFSTDRGQFGQLRTADAYDVESRELCSIRRACGVLHTLRWVQMGWMSRGRASEVLPGKGSGRRCGAVEGTRWKNWWWPGKSALWSVGGSSGFPPSSHLVPAWKHRNQSPYSQRILN